MRWSSTDLESQLEHFRDVDSGHYEWQTSGGYFSKTERELLLSAQLPTSGAVLEIGCGEGGNLFHLGCLEQRKTGWVGLDFAPSKLAHAHAKLPDVEFVCGDAAHLPFGDAQFDAVLIRDVLHHVDDRQQVVGEAMRVLRRGGAVAIIEPNRNSPLIVAQALAIRAERAVLRSTAKKLEGELKAAGFTNTSVKHAQPFPLARVALHPRLGTAKYGRSKRVAALLRGVDSVASRFISRGLWMYLVGRGTKED